MKHFFLLIIFIFVYGFSQAQVSEHEPALKDAPQINNPDKKLFIALNTGLAFAGGSDPVMSGYTWGAHLEINAKYFIFHHLAIMAKVGGDIASGDNAQSAFESSAYADIGGYGYGQYMGGLCLMAGTSKSKSQFNFIALGGLVTSGLPNYEENYGGTITYDEMPGGGQGFGSYFGIELTHLKRRVGFNIGLGMLYSAIYYPSYSISTYPPYGFVGPSTFTNQPTTMFINILQIHFGITFGE